MPDVPPTGVPESIEEWLAILLAEYGLPADSVDAALILDLARDAAHTVARPAAPITTFLAGLAAGRAGGSAEDIAQAVATARRALGSQ
jgi:hypothetical protein